MPFNPGKIALLISPTRSMCSLALPFRIKVPSNPKTRDTADEPQISAPRCLRRLKSSIGKRIPPGPNTTPRTQAFVQQSTFSLRPDRPSREQDTGLLVFDLPRVLKRATERNSSISTCHLDSRCRRVVYSCRTRKCSEAGLALASAVPRSDSPLVRFGRSFTKQPMAMAQSFCMEYGCCIGAHQHQTWDRVVLLRIWCGWMRRVGVGLIVGFGLPPSSRDISAQYAWGC